MENLNAAGGVELVELTIEFLIGRRYTSIPYQRPFPFRFPFNFGHLLTLILFVSFETEYAVKKGEQCPPLWRVTKSTVCGTVILLMVPTNTTHRFDLVLP